MGTGIGTGIGTGGPARASPYDGTSSERRRRDVVHRTDRRGREQLDVPRVLLARAALEAAGERPGLAGGQGIERGLDLREVAERVQPFGATLDLAQGCGPRNRSTASAASSASFTRSRSSRTWRYFDARLLVL